MDPRWQTVLESARSAHAQVPALQEFCPFPSALTEQEVAAHFDPLSDRMRMDTGLVSDHFSGFRDALIEAAPLARWRETYRNTPIGDDLHRQFGCYEILGGTDSPFGTDEMRGFMVYQVPGYHYPLHHHPAEEIYLVLAGEAEFHIEGQNPRVLRAGDTAFHASNQSHALTTYDTPVLAYVLWRGDLMTKPVFTYPEALT